MAGEDGATTPRLEGGEGGHDQTALPEGEFSEGGKVREKMEGEFLEGGGGVEMVRYLFPGLPPDGILPLFPMERKGT